ncbi:hypothetical protein [Demequina sp.]|uniref:hypothetical protein n=1 Tax=Demequina sp. TaxID=2050685 RepID=UPI003A8B0017
MTESGNGAGAGEYILQPDGSYLCEQRQPDGSVLYFQQLPDGAFGYFVPREAAAPAYFRRLPDGTFQEWVQAPDGSYVPPAVTTVPPIAPDTGAWGSTAASAGLGHGPRDAEVADVATPSAPRVPGAARKPALIAGVAAGVVVILGVGIFAGMHLLGGRSAERDTGLRVADMATEPAVGWTFDMALGIEPGYAGYVSYAVVGDDRVLVAPNFDFVTFEADTASLPYWNYDVTWTSTYEAEYDTGWDAGLAYEQAYDAWSNDTTWEVEYPDEEEFWPGESDVWSPDAATDGGMIDGYNDARSGFEYGENRLSKPVSPDFEPTVAMVDLVTGQERWSLSLADLWGGDAVDLEVVDAGDGRHAVVSMAVAGAEPYDEFVVVDVDKGTIVGSVKVDGGLARADVDSGEFYLVEEDPDGTSTTVARYDITNIAGDPSWEVDVDGYAYVGFEPDFLTVRGDEYVALDRVTGEPTAFSRQLDDNTTVIELSGVLVRIEYDDEDPAEIMAIDAEGKDAWDSPVKAESLSTTDGYLWVGDGNDGWFYESMNHIDLRTGEPVWEKDLDAEHSGVSGVQDGYAYISGDGEILKVSMSSGEIVDSFRATVEGVWLGKSMLFALDGDEFISVGFDDLSENWAMDLDEDQSVSPFGSHLMIVEGNELLSLES